MMPAAKQIERMAKPARRQFGFLLLMTGVAALGGLLFGYDTAVISGAIGPLAAHFHLGAAATGWAASSALAGCVLGAAGAGWGCDLYGRHRFLLLAGICFLVSAAGTAMANSLGTLVAFRILGGMGIGAASVVSPLYISESSPARWRGRLVAVNQLAIVSGMLLIYLVNYQITHNCDAQWNETTGWRWMFASGILPSALLMLLLSTVPETARFLLLKGRSAEAEKVAALTGAEMLNEIHAGEHSAVPILNRKRMYAVGILLAVLQQVTGINVFLYYAPSIFAHASHSGDVALQQTIAVGAVNVIFTIIAMLLVDRAGRKPLLLGGSAGMAVCLVAMGWAIMRGNNSAWLLFFVLAYIACFALSVGPVTWILLAELFPSKSRGMAMAVSTAVLWAANFVVSQTFPMLDQSARLIARFNHGFPFFFYAGFCLLEIWFVAAFVPETKNKRLEEIARQWSVKE
ncbi:sugar porter family MFS transporter [Terracidiphilus gabretensis]|jgi:SP family xylose:H+ symportor-like MFS transporter|uniref:sugar porter family MFS transporter n=1 Tax=Terracidiphilus gabretensis TaxID=1577687 RepID=UPI00071B7662|nr:sugar porter family MFS transporter [Terracidiphilus gabretensis]